VSKKFKWEFILIDELLELAHDWLYHFNLAEKRILVSITNSVPTPSSTGYEHGFLEKFKGMIMSADKDADAVTVHLYRPKQTALVPLRFLCPEEPTKKSQPVVVLGGERQGQVLLTRAPTPTGLFPLVPHGQSKGKAPPLCELPVSLLARCDPK